MELVFRQMPISLQPFRETYPHSLNLGSGGSGPLIQLAILKEYVGEVQPMWSSGSIGRAMTYPT